MICYMHMQWDLDDVFYFQNILNDVAIRHKIIW